MWVHYSAYVLKNRKKWTHLDQKSDIKYQVETNMDVGEMLDVRIRWRAGVQPTPSATWLNWFLCRLGLFVASSWLADRWGLRDRRWWWTDGTAGRVGALDFCQLCCSGDGEVWHRHGDWGCVLVREVIGWRDLSMYQRRMFWWMKRLQTIFCPSKQRITLNTVWCEASWSDLTL